MRAYDERSTTDPRPPCYAVVFTSLRTPGDDGYADRSDEMERLASFSVHVAKVERSYDFHR